MLVDRIQAIDVDRAGVTLGDAEHERVCVCVCMCCMCCVCVCVCVCVLSQSIVTSDAIRVVRVC